ncbi:hypothetical protein CkaCkLH20_11812 [Colletotrichum karsti]|uniref:BHLH domain-containing protein n=1 Tax=Colletotrichum karsti TaxID=1095194 RepID=A0A9P6HV78_9PEZI|nr:uncharacterized protein CkaCkLH20_11812 [Colletotrichum karsti]KAF9870710.1 hypothetical protein CkaCkLH20_11812 [Colletotrichum karsti]
MNTTAQGTATSDHPTATASERVPGRKGPKKRVRNFTADDRAAHRIFERGRREAFKVQLIELAANLPALADTDPQRLSKHVVVTESLARLRLLENRCIDALRGVESLMQERDELLAEVNNWRRARGGGSLRQPRRVVANVDGLVETEKDTQRRAAAAQLAQTTRKSSEQSGGPSDEQGHSGVASNELSEEASHVPRVLPSEPTQDARTVSEMDSLLLDTSWPQVTQSQPGDYSGETASMAGLAVMSDQAAAMQANELSDNLPVSTSNMNDYQLSYQDMDSMDFTGTETSSFGTSDLPTSASYLGSSGMNQGMQFQQQQQWVSWPG